MVFDYLFTFMSGILSISKLAVLGIHSMALIAGSREMMNVENLAEGMNASKSHVAKVTGMLVKSKFLFSERGPKGGFRLRIPADKISLMSIFEVFEGKLSGNCCLLNTGKCTLESCLFGNLSGKFTGEFIQYMENTLLKDILNKSSLIEERIPCH